jgi:hypothetical protein
MIVYTQCGEVKEIIIKDVTPDHTEANNLFVII